MSSKQALRFYLHGDDNKTVEGTLILDDFNFLSENNGDNMGTEAPPGDAWANYDQAGASVYATVVIAVYGFSIVLLIGSHIFLKKKENKRDGDEQQIDKYLAQVPSLKEKSKRDSFRRLKRSIIPLVTVGMGADITGLSASAVSPNKARQDRDRKNSITEPENEAVCQSGRSSPVDLSRPLLDVCLEINQHNNDSKGSSLLTFAMDSSCLGESEGIDLKSTMPIIYEDDDEGKQSPDKCGQGLVDENMLTSNISNTDSTDQSNQVSDVTISVPDDEDLWIMQDRTNSRSPSPSRLFLQHHGIAMALESRGHGSRYKDDEYSLCPDSIPRAEPLCGRISPAYTPPGSPRWLSTNQSKPNVKDSVTPPRSPSPRHDLTQPSDQSEDAEQVTCV